MCYGTQMNKHALPQRPPVQAVPDYELDGYGWAMAQARLLRERQEQGLDWDNVAEEIESMGKQQAQSAESQLRVVLTHWLKWKHQPSRRSRSWSNSVKEHLRRFDRFLSRNPSLKPLLDQILADAYSDARFDASEQTGLEIETFREAPPSWDEIRGPLPD